MKYKESLFNILFENNCHKYLYNTLSGTLIRLSEDELCFLKDIRKEKEDIDRRDFFPVALKKGLIVREDFDEFGYIFQKTQYHIYNQFPENVSFTVVLTNRCNFRCKYCFEPDTQDLKEIDVGLTGDFIIGQIKRNPNLKRLRITWFGGEPLLNSDAIQEITGRILPIMTEREIEYSASIITNGFFLNRCIIENNNISSVQVTLDGIRDVYNDYKGVSGETYDVVLKNLEDLIFNSKTSVGIRLNCDRYNIESIFELINVMDDMGVLDRAFTHLAPIYSGTDSDLTEEEYAEAEYRYLKLLKCRGKDNVLMRQLHRSRVMSCGFMGYGSYVIDVDGSLKKCERDVGIPEMTIGDVIHGKYYNSIEMNYQIGDIERKCWGCGYYPLCRGGCRKMRMLDKSVDCKAFQEGRLRLLKLIVS